ncbi:hypothetical protein [Microbacterium sp. TNHR37B]|uniref:hypothetical protein n=1 Tax=Microbacterium sp. TNHR37B TaxID=1775956 RepID=UPI0007B1D0CF|nr:hypothetical protein [Microbacterium sp. TNHR37B]KZE89539.1 hypothetical protein AVP41_02337 [Microbacterium sp. TNHR37B]
MRLNRALLAGTIAIVFAANGAAAQASEVPVDDPAKVAEHESSLRRTDVVGTTVRVQDDLTRMPTGIPLLSYSQKSTATFRFQTEFFTTDSDYTS